MFPNNPHMQAELSTACLPRQGLQSSYVGHHRYGRNWQCYRALQDSDVCRGETMKNKVQKSAKDRVYLSLLLMEQLISSFLLPEEGSGEDPASSVIRSAFLTA